MSLQNHRPPDYDYRLRGHSAGSLRDGCRRFRLRQQIVMLLRLMPSVEALCSRAGGGGGQDARHAQKNQAQIEAHNEAVVPMDAIHKALTDAPQRHQLEQIRRR